MIPNTLGTLWTDVRKQKLRNNTLTVGEIMEWESTAGGESNGRMVLPCKVPQICVSYKGVEGPWALRLKEANPELSLPPRPPVCTCKPLGTVASCPRPFILLEGLQVTDWPKPQHRVKAFALPVANPV